MGRNNLTISAYKCSQAIPFKFLSFNVYGNQLQSLSAVQAVSFNVSGFWAFGKFVPGVNALSNPGFELNTVGTDPEPI